MGLGRSLRCVRICSIVYAEGYQEVRPLPKPHLAHLLGKIGGVEIGIVHDMTLLGFTAQTWLPCFDRDRVREHESWLCPDHYDPETGRMPSSVHSFILRTDHHIILVDTCIGNDRERPGIPEMHRLSTNYLGRLSSLGVEAEDIDFVMCTHLHVDHVGWNTRLLDGRWVPTFPNARYIFARAELAQAEADERDAIHPAVSSCFRDSILPIVEDGRADLVDDVHDILDLLTLRPAPGHSPGHLRIELRSEREIGVFSGDILHSPIQVPFWEWSSQVCWDAEQSAQSRRELLEFCAAEDALLLPAHFVFPHVGRISESHSRFKVSFGW
jgi:glyoxylase-like metal-dependent hydrolase (beta-lactamase superfamily II)